MMKLHLVSMGRHQTCWIIVLQEKAVLAMKTAYRKSELVGAVITVQICSTNQYASDCGIFNPQYLMHIELFSTFIDVIVIRPGKKC